MGDFHTPPMAPYPTKSRRPKTAALRQRQLAGLKKALKCGYLRDSSKPGAKKRIYVRVQRGY